VKIICIQVIFMQDNCMEDKNRTLLENLDDPRSCVCFLLSRAAQTAQKHLRNMLEPYGLTPAQYLIMECLWICDRLSPKEIAELLRLDSATLTGLIDRLERLGFVTRERDLKDRRAIRVCLTGRSSDMKEELRAVRIRANEEILSIFGEKERERLKSDLAALISADEQMAPISWDKKQEK